MPTDHAPNHHVTRTNQFASLAAILATLVGSMVLAGWAFDIAVLKSVLPGWVAMKANTAVCFILIGIALWLTARQQSAIHTAQSAFRNPQPAIIFARLCELLVGLIGLLTLCEYIFGWNPGIDQWLVYEPPGAVGTSYPGRMAPETALCFVLLPMALWLIGGSRHIRKNTRWTILASVSIGLLVATLALAAGLSYPMPGLGTYGWFGLTIMAMHTAILFAMLGMAVIAISWQQDVLQWSLGRNITAAFVCGMALLVLIGLNINRSQFWLDETNRKIAYSEEVQDYIESILVEIIDAQAHTRGYIITGDEQFKAHYFDAKANSNVKLDALRKRIVGNPHHQQQFARIETQAKAQLQWFQQAIDTRQAGMADATRNNMFRHGEGLLDNFRTTYDQIKSEHQQFIKELKRESKSVAQLSYITIATGTLVSLLIFLTVIFRLNFAVNERMQKERALQENEEKFRKITESAQDAVIMMGADQRISFWNIAAERIFGYTAVEAMGQELHALIAPAPARAGFAQAFPHFQRTGEGPIIGKVRELTALRKNGEEFTVELSISAARFGGQWHAIGIVRDITERKRLAEQQAAEYRHIAEINAQLTEANRQLKQAQGQLLQSEKMAAIGNLAAGVAHEINNPVGYVNSNIGTLEKYLADIFAVMDKYEATEKLLYKDHPQLEELRQLKQKIDIGYLRKDIGALIAESQHGLERVKRIVLDLKNFSRADTEEHWEHADLHKGMDATLNVVWNELKYKCEVVKEYGQLPEVYCLPAQLDQVFLNLLVNAAQAIETRGKITIRTGQEDGKVWVEVSDTGKGIPPEDIPHLFEPFFTTKPVGQGTGLGLSVSYSIVEKHHGKIEVHSEVGKGSTFRVWLPVLQPGIEEAA